MLADDLMTDIAKELMDEADNVAEKLYDMEFFSPREKQ